MLVLGIGDSSGDICDAADVGNFLGENCIFDVDNADDADVGDFFLAQ
jgi:hypothetical protein